MRLLDKFKTDPGKIFDVLLVLVAVFSLFVFGLKYVLKKEKLVTVTIKVTPDKWFWGDQPPPNWYALSVKEGDKEFNSLGQTIAEIVKVKRFDTGGVSKVLYVKVKLRSIYHRQTKAYYFKDKPIELNSTIQLNLKNTSLEGVVTQIDGFPQQNLTKELIVDLILYERYPWYVDMIKKGDKYTSGGEVLAEVLDKKITLSKKTVVILGELRRSGEDVILPIARDPLMRDVVLKMKIKVKREGEKDWVFRTDQLVKVGNQLNIPLDNNVNLFSANILSIRKVDKKGK